MKVKEVIEELSKYNPKAEVSFCTVSQNLVLLSIFSDAFPLPIGPKTDSEVIFDLEDKKWQR